MGVQNSKTLVENHYEHKILENIGENFNLVKEVQDSRYGLIRVMERSERGKEFTLDPAD